MGFAQCTGPIWLVDDFTVCFQQDYLKIILPLLVVALSFTHILWRNAQSLYGQRKTQAYSRLATDEHAAHDHTELPPDEEAEVEEEEALEINAGRLSLTKTTTKGSIIKDTPTGQYLWQFVEELGVVGLVATNAVALSTRTYTTSHGQLTAIAGLIVWIYALILTTLRLLLGNSKWRIPHLWNHTVTIYGFNWLFMVFIFRSVLIRPTSKTAQVLVIVEFAIVSLLFGMAVSTRKGNKTVVLEWEDGIEPSREPLASLFSVATFGWVDSIIYKGWKQPMELEHVWNLLPKDKAAHVLADYRQMKRTSSLAFHLLRYFKRDLFVQCGMAVISGIFTFAPTLLLKAILRYVESSDRAPINVLWLYVIGLPVLDMVRSWGDGMALWIGRKICIRVRAIIVGEIYAKALRRKAASGKEKVLLQAKPAANDGGDVKEGTGSKLKRALGLKKKKENSSNSDTESGIESLNQSIVADDEQANLGTIINLMSVDSFKIAEITAYLHFLCAAAPTMLVVSIVLLWQVMGLSAIPGIIVMVFLLPINYFIGKGFSTTSKNILAATDKRINITNEVLQNIRIIKYFAWEERFGMIIDEKRHAELKALRSRFMVWATAVAIWNFVPVLITFFSFLVYTLIEKKPLYPSVAFTAISLFMLLRIPLDQLGDMFAHVQEAKVSIDRVDEFLNEDETEKYEQLGTDNVDEDGVRRIGFRDATLIWGGRDTVADDGSRAFRLLEMNVDFQIGKLNIIAGPTGSGKTSMLMGLLGEMTMVEGRVFCPGGQSREDARVDPETGLTNTIAYVAQAAWLVNANIRNNILFAAPYDEQRYKDVIVACALERDLEILDHGDETVVGEKGITLSGGQKQRISLARALYSNSAHLLLDDCLSAVDSHTAKWIFSNCIKGPLMANRTCILVTHNVQLCVPSSEYVVVLDNGRVAVQGLSAQVIASGKLGEEIKKANPASTAPSRVPSRVPSSVGDEEANGETTNGVNGIPDKKKKAPPPQQDAMGEGKVTGAVKWPVMKLYLASMGSWWFWIVTFVVFNAQQLATVAIQVWVREWSNQYVVERAAGVSWVQALRSSSSNVKVMDLSLYHVGPPTQESLLQTNLSNVNVPYYLFVLAIIGLASAGTALMRDLWLFFGSLTASRRIHDMLIRSVARAQFRFFDVTPLGQIINRFSKDLEAIDQDVAPTAVSVMSCALSLVVTVILISVITPGFLIAAAFIGVLFYLVSVFYLRASRDLKRLESVHRSPLFQQFGETLHGMTTIRAYGEERRFIRDNLSKINTQARPFIYLWACNRWLALRADLLGDLVAFSAGVFIILSLGKVDAGAAGMSLSYAMNFTENLLWLVRNYAINEQNMNSMERVKEYLDVEQEADEIVEDNRPDPSWPAKGAVEFTNYSTRYRADLEPVLHNISLKINPQEKVGIVGRTGAGKSSLTLAIFRALEADSGTITIDDVDISKIGLRDLRENVTIVPQDPTLFQGTLRTNLDPFEQYTDEEVFAALRRVQLIGPDEPSTSPPTPRVPGSVNSAAPSVATNKNIFLDLASPISESGSNLSQGQRQLTCLARAMLKNPTVLVMDEATASIDYVTDSKIQETIRELTGTVITIAHRLQTIVDYDKVLVLDKGEVVEYAHPWELINNEQTLFRSMCEMSGDLDILMEAAKRKWDSGRLVDDS